MKNWNLTQLDKPLKKLVLLFIIVLTIGFATGLIYLTTTSGLQPSSVQEHYNGSTIDPADEFAIPDSYPKPVGELLITTHGHVIQFAFIYFILGALFYFNSRISGKAKLFIMFEPFFSIVITFGGLWVMRYIFPQFVYLVIISSTLMYLCYFIMAGTIIRDCFSSKD